MKTILLVEDTPILAENISDILRNSGFHVELAVSAEDALMILASINPDLIVTDVLMPMMDGIEFIKILRRIPRYAKLPIIILSARATAEDLERGKSAGANWYLTKPCTADELIDSITKTLEQ